MTYPEAIQFLYNLRLFGTKLGLDNTRQLAALAGSPQDTLRFIHVAGTNGKGSVCAMLESIYRQAGWRVGLFTSPHLVAFGERIQVNRVPIPEADVARWTGFLRSLLGTFDPDHHPTFFEVVTVMALAYFAEQQCDLVVWETGMGGRLDATNIVIPLLSVITNVAYDHERWLGHTLAEVAREKAGILKPGVPAVIGPLDPEAARVVEQTAGSCHAPLRRVLEEEQNRAPLDRLVLPLLGDHQRGNAALACAAVELLQEPFPVSDTILRRGLESVHWPGRMQLIHTASGQQVLLDGAHNPSGCQALKSALQRHFPGQSPALILGVLQDKDWTGMCRTLAPLGRRIGLVPVQSMRSALPEDLRPVCQQANADATITLHPNLGDALNALAQEPFILLTGSLYFIGEAMEKLGVSPAQAVCEKGLNEWEPSPSISNRP